jgi:hypothetical protein
MTVVLWSAGYHHFSDATPHHRNGTTATAPPNDWAALQRFTGSREAAKDAVLKTPYCGYYFWGFARRVAARRSNPVDRQRRFSARRAGHCKNKNRTTCRFGVANVEHVRTLRGFVPSCPLLPFWVSLGALLRGAQTPSTGGVVLARAAPATVKTKIEPRAASA